LNVKFEAAFSLTFGAESFELALDVALAVALAVALDVALDGVLTVAFGMTVLIVGS